MADFTDGTEENILDWFFNTTGPPTRPTTWWVSLFSVTPTADDGTGGTELSETGYLRQQVSGGFTRTGQTLNPPSILTFGPAGEDWAEALSFGVHSLVSAGTIYAFKVLSTSRTVLNGDSAEFATADLTITLD